jgi:hypothetical protein
LPDGEEGIHYFDVKCGCFPKHSINDTGKTVVVHNSYDGRDIFEMAVDSPFHTIRQKHDC